MHMPCFKVIGLSVLEKILERLYLRLLKFLRDSYHIQTRLPELCDRCAFFFFIFKSY